MSTYGELFAGVGGMTMGFERAGFEPLWHVEIDRYCQSVLRHQWPYVPVHGDVTGVYADEEHRGCENYLEPVDVLAFGSPCQDLSQAGKRLGFKDGERSVLFHEAIRIIKEMRDVTDGAQPRWAVWENVGGALNSHGGADFGTALDALADAGALVIEWAQLDAQFFGVPQRRKRVFVVACFDPAAAGRCPDPLLALAEGGSRSAVQSREARAEAGGAAADGAALYVAGSERDTANCLTARQGKGVPTWMDDGGIVVYAGGKPNDVTNSLTARQGARSPSRLDMTNVVVYARGAESETAAPLLTRQGGRTQIEGNIVAYSKGRRAHHAEDNETWHTDRPAPTLAASDNTGEVRATVLAVHLKQDPISSDDVAPCLSTMDRGMSVGVLDGARVRRLAPVEAERLMGWPDNHTAQGDQGKISDTQRGKMIGNGVATPVAEFIARSIKEADHV